LDVVPKNLSVTLGSTFSKTLSTFAACRSRVSLYCTMHGNMQQQQQQQQQQRRSMETLTSSHFDM
jgi:hypothetical protein